MSKCFYTYKGKEFFSKEELADYVMSEESSVISSTPISTSEKVRIVADAKSKFGSAEFIMFHTDENGQEMFSINQEAFNDILNNAGNETRSKEDIEFGELLDEVKDNIIEQIEYRGQERNDLKTRLYNFLNNLGVSVNVVDSVEGDIEAIADIGNRLITLSNKENIAEFSEEVGHFAIEWMDDTNQLEKMIDAVDKTTEYKNSFLKYKIKYAQEGLKGTALDRKVRKEILGKILAQKIIDNFNKENTRNDSEIGIFSQLENLWNKFLDLFRITDSNKEFFKEFNQVLDLISNNVIEGETKLFNPNNSTEIYYSLSEEGQRLRTKLTSLTQELQEQYKGLTDQDLKGKKLRRLSDIMDGIKNSQFLISTQSYIQLIKNDLVNAQTLIETSRRENPNDAFAGIKNVDLMSIQLSNQFLQSNLATLESIVISESLDPNSLISSKEADILISEIKDVRRIYNEISSPLVRLNEIKMKSYIEKTLDSLPITATQRERFMKGIVSVADITGISRWIKSPAFMGNSLVQLIVVELMKMNHTIEEISMKQLRELEKYSELSNDDVNDKITDGHYIANGVKAELFIEEEKEKELIRKHFEAKAEELRANNESPDKFYDLEVEKEMVMTLFRAKYRPTYLKGVQVTDNTTLRKRNGNIYGDLVRVENSDIVGEVTNISSTTITLTNSRLETIEIPTNSKLISIEGFKGIHPSATHTIKAYNQAKNTILKKYYVGGRVNTSIISAEDSAALTALTSDFKRAQSEFNEHGVKKQGIDLIIAEDIKKYYADRTSITKTELSKEDKEEFEQELTKAQQLSPEQFAKWAKVNTQYTYDQEVFESMDSGDDVDDEIDIEDNKKATILAALGLEANTTLSNSELNTLLKEKRTRLVAPHKEIGKFNEILGDTIENNLPLKTSLDSIQTMLSYIPKIKEEENKTIGVGMKVMTKNRESGVVESLVNGVASVSFKNGSIRNIDVTQLEPLKVDFIPQANAAFNRKLASLEGAERKSFILNNVVHIQGVPQPDNYGSFQPSKYYYRTNDVYVNGRMANKRYVPSFNWILGRSEKEEKNPEFSNELAEKGIPQYNEFMRNKYRNDKFFSDFGIDPNLDFYALKGATKNKEIFELRQTLLRQKAEVDRVNNLRGEYYTRPAVPASSRELALSGKNPSKIGDTIRAIAKRTFTVGDGIDDEDFQTTEAAEGANTNSMFYKVKYRNNIVSRFRGKLRDKNGEVDPSLLSQDLIYSYSAYVNEGYASNERGKTIPTVQMIVDKIARTPLEGGVDYKDSNLKKVLDDYVAAQLYGQTMESGYILNIAGQKISTTKASRALYNTFSKINLGLNISVAFTGVINAQMKVIAEKYVNDTVSSDSVNFGYLEFTRLMPEFTKSVGEVNPKSKLKQLFRFSNMDMVHELNQGVTLGRGYRVLTDQPVMMPLALAGNVTAANSILMIMDAYRLTTIGYRNNVTGKLYNTKQEAGEDSTEVKDFKNQRGFLTFQKELLGDKYDEKVALENFRALKEHSYYNYLIQDEQTNEISLDTTRLKANGYNLENIDSLKTNMVRNIKSFHAQKEGQLTPEEKTALSRNAILSHTMLHRGWAVRLIHERINTRHDSLITGAEVEGSYSTLARLSVDAYGDGYMELLKLYGSMLSFGLYTEGLKNLSELERSNIKRIQADLALVAASMAIFLLLGAAADEDEDNAALQFFSYIAARNLNETLSSQFPFAVSEAKNILQEPIAGVGMVTDLVSAPFNAITNYASGEEVKSGTFKGLPKWQRDLYKMTVLKNVIGTNDASTWKSKTVFLRNNSAVMKNMNEIFLED